MAILGPIIGTIGGGAELNQQSFPGGDGYQLVANCLRRHVAAYRYRGV